MLGHVGLLLRHCYPHYYYTVLCLLFHGWLAVCWYAFRYVYFYFYYILRGARVL